MADLWEDYPKNGWTSHGLKDVCLWGGEESSDMTDTFVRLFLWVEEMSTAFGGEVADVSFRAVADVGENGGEFIP